MQPSPQSIDLEFLFPSLVTANFPAPRYDSRGKLLYEDLRTTLLSHHVHIFNVADPFKRPKQPEPVHSEKWRC
jgi:hypothetical protein